MAIQTPSGNTTLLASQVANLLIQPLEQQSTFLSAGPTIIDSAGPVRIPRVASGATAAFVAPGAQISDSNANFDEVQLLPSTLRGIKVLTKLSSELIRQSVVGLEAVLRQRLVTDVANVLDAALWDGTGSSDSIKGILRATGIATSTLDLTDPDSLIDGLATAQGNKINPTHWVMTPASFATLRKLKVNETTDARYLLDANLHEGTTFQLFGLPVIITDNIPNAGTAPGKARVALVDFSHVVVARDEDTNVAILDQTFGDYDTVGIRVTTRYDVTLTQAKAVTLLTEA
jgi:HK97 family phage major capsid protein